LEVALDAFERQFPQAFAAIYIGQLPRQLRPAELGFWLLNHGAFNTPQVTKRNDFGLVVVVDFQSGACSITLGYALESLLEAKKLAAISRKLASRLKRSQMGLGLIEATRQMAKLLCRGATPERRHFGHHSPAAPGIGLSNLRAGHQHSPDPRVAVQASTVS
jgi:hypothetical protein